MRHDQTSNDRAYQKADAVDFGWVDEWVGKEEYAYGSASNAKQQVARRCQDRTSFL